MTGGAAAAGGAERFMAWAACAVLVTDLLLVLLWAYRKAFLRKETFAPVWSVMDVWVGGQVVLVLLFLLLVPFLTVLNAAGVRDPWALTPESRAGLLYVVVPSAILQNVSFFAVPAGVIVGKYGQRLRDIGLGPLPRARDLWAGVLLGLAAFAVSGLLESGLVGLAREFRHVPEVAAALRHEETNEVARIVRSLPRHGPAALVFAVLAIGVSAPFGEEMFFRGFLLRALRRRLGVTAGLLLSSLLFTAAHAYAFGLVPVFLFGVLLAWVYHVSGSLWTCVLMHAVNNTLAVCAAYFLS